MSECADDPDRQLQLDVIAAIRACVVDDFDQLLDLVESHSDLSGLSSQLALSAACYLIEWHGRDVATVVAMLDDAARATVVRKG
jgi:hypothetical protein